MATNFNFFKVPNNVFELGLNAYQLVVYMYLCRCSNNTNEAFPSYKTIADKCGMSKNKAVSTVNELAELGLVKKVNRFSDQTKQSNVYKVKKNITIPPHGIGVYHDMVQGIPQDGHNKETIYKEPLEEEYNNNTSILTNTMAVYYLSDYESDYKEDVENALQYYYDSYREKTGKTHPRLKPEQLYYAYEQIEDVITDIYDIEATIDEFFDTVKNTDHNLNHFVSDGIIHTLKERNK